MLPRAARGVWPGAQRRRRTLRPPPGAPLGAAEPRLGGKRDPSRRPGAPGQAGLRRDLTAVSAWLWPGPGPDRGTEPRFTHGSPRGRRPRPRTAEPRSPVKGVRPQHAEASTEISKSHTYSPNHTQSTQSVDIRTMDIYATAVHTHQAHIRDCTLQTDINLLAHTQQLGISAPALTKR